MKKITFALLLFAGLSTWLLVNESFKQPHEQVAQIKANEKVKRGIAGALNYLNRIRMNPQTGVVNDADVLKARNKADMMQIQKSGSAIMDWEFIGPNNVGGRTRAIFFNRNNPSHMLAGGVAGGLWFSLDGGLNWQEHPINAQITCLSVSALAQATNGDIYMGTGEKIVGWSVDFYGTGNSAFPGCGIYKSTDGGLTFSLLETTTPAPNSNNNQWSYIIALETHPNNPNWVYAATERSLYLSTDGGATWSSPEGISASSGTAFDVKAGSDGIIHALVSSRYYRSDNGTTFVDKSGSALGQFPVLGNNKKLAVSPANPNYLYVVTTKSDGCLNKVFQSANGGETWIVIGEGVPGFFDPASGGGYCQGWYDLCIIADPSNAERIFVGGITVWSWSAQDNWLPVMESWGGATNPFYMHVDIHTFAYHPTNANILFVGNDGGIYRTTNAKSLAPTWRALNKNYNVTQFYAIAAGMDGRVMGGTQDNGTIFTTFNTNSYFAGDDVTGGDGGYSDISKINPMVAFAANQEGRLRRSANGGVSFGYSGFLDENIDCEPSNPDGSCNPDGLVDNNPEFITPTILYEDLDNNLAVYATGNGAGQVWITLEALSVSKVPEWHRIGAFTGGGTVSTVNIAKDPSGKIMVVAGSASGRILILRNVLQNEFSGNPTVSPTGSINSKLISATTITGASQSRYVTSIAVNQANPNEIIVTMGNYGLGNYVFRTLNAYAATPTFETVQGIGADALPPMPVYDLIIDVDNPSRLFAGTDMGVWMCEMIQTGTSTYEYVWTEQNNTIGRVPVFRIRQEPMGKLGCNVLYIGTHGRGFFRSATFTFPPPTCDVSLPEWGSAVGVNTVLPNILAVKIAPNPVQGKATIMVELGAPATEAKVMVYNLQGKLFQQTDLNPNTTGAQSIPLQVELLPPGAYIAVLKTNTNQSSTKFVVQ